MSGSEPEALGRAAEAALAEGRPDDARALAEAIRSQTPDAPALAALESAMAEAAGDPLEALRILEHATRDRPEPMLLLRLANLCRRRFQTDAALATAERALETTPPAARIAPLLELARIHIDRDEPDAARRHLLHALAIDSTHAETHYALSTVLLADGEFAPGWIEYEWRNHLPGADSRIGARISAPVWNGMRLPRGRLLVLCDQGFGDTLQFARLLPLAAGRVSELVLACGPEIASLLHRVPGVSLCVDRWDRIPPFTCHVPITSLPGLLGVGTWADPPIPAAIPYLAADPARADAWHARLGLRDGIRRVGIAWAGRSIHPNDRRRSLSLPAFAPLLAALRSETVVSLQRERAAIDAERLRRLGVRDLSDAMIDFAETAAIVVNLDLVVTIDTAVAHLAGALGRPVALLLASPADWRWGRAGTTTPWYPSLRLFRQDRPGDWGSAIATLGRWLDEGEWRA